MSRFAKLSISVLFFICSISVQSQTCYAPNGKPFDNDTATSSHQPCTSGGPSTICCALNRSNPPGGDSSKGVTKDECLPNGLCQNRMTSKGVETITYWANYCTDSNFTSGNCLDICEQTRGATGNTAMTSCNGRADSEKWCCGANNPTCCTSGIGVVRLPQTFGGFISSEDANSTQTRLSSSSTSSSPTTSPQTGSPSASPSPEKNSSISRGAIAGIVIGILAVLAILTAVMFLAKRASNRRKQALSKAESTDTIYAYYKPQSGETFYGELSQQNEKYELSQGRNHPVELQQPPSELPGEMETVVARRPDVMITSPNGSSAPV